MKMNESENNTGIDWSLTTWEGSRREQYRRWSKLSLREIVQAQEEMQKLADRFQELRARRKSTPTKNDT